LTLTGTAGYSAGTSFFDKPIDTHHVVVAFESIIGGGSGADGQTLVLADPSRGATPASLGYRGGGLGFSGIPGIAVALDTFKGAGAPAANFMGITDGPTSPSTLDSLHWLATNTTVPALRATRHVKVEVLNGTVSVWIEGTKVLTQAVTLPAQALLGFGGGTGGLTDNHQVANVSITGDAPPAGTPASASLRIPTTVVAPAGSPQASATFVYSGTCPSSFTSGAKANGDTATPTLTGAVEGSSCAFGEAVPAAPAGAKWTVSAAVNGAAPQTLAIASGRATLPAFALKAGVNTVAFTNTYTPPASGPLLPDPAAGGWQLNGTAKLAGTSLQLTEATAYAAGSAFWPVAIDPRALRVEYDASIGGGSGADGMALVLGDVSKGALPTSLGYRGGGLGFSGIPGLAVALDEFKNAVNPSNNFVGVSDGPTASGPDTLHWLGTATLLAALQEATHHVTVTTTSTSVTVAIDGTTVLTQPATLPASAYLGFSAGTGGLTNRHAVASVLVTATG
jgi:hypothetical protein